MNPQISTVDFNERPFIAIWEVTQACDLACVHCRASAQPDRNPLELSTEEGKGLIDQIAALQVPVFVLTGGDPIKRPDLFELIAHAWSRGVRISLTPGAPSIERSVLDGWDSKNPNSHTALSSKAKDPQVPLKLSWGESLDKASHWKPRNTEGAVAFRLLGIAKKERLGLQARKQPQAIPALSNSHPADLHHPSRIFLNQADCGLGHFHCVEWRHPSGRISALQSVVRIPKCQPFVRIASAGGSRRLGDG